MEQIPSLEANRSSASQEILRFLWNIFKSLPPVPVLSQINPVDAPIALLEYQFSDYLPSTPESPKLSLSLRSPYLKPVCIFLLTHTCYMPHQSHSKIIMLLVM
jgi:hypothetical protein